MLARRAYGLLVPAEPAGNPADAETQVSGDGHKDTMETEDQDQRETATGDGTGQRALLVHSMPEDTDKERRPPEW